MDYCKIDEFGNELFGGIAPSDIPAEVKDKHYTHLQTSANDIWDVVHNLGKCPSVVITDTEETQVYAGIEYLDNNNLQIKFNYPCCGKVYCN